MPSELEGHRMADADNIEGIRFKKEVRDEKMPGQVRFCQLYQVFHLDSE